MIATHPSIGEALLRLGMQPGKSRSRCPIHQGESASLSFDEDRGLWFCHRCGVGGDLIRLVELARGIDFKSALGWLGLDASVSLQPPDLEALRRRREQERIQCWADRLGRELRSEFYTRELVICRALERLRRDEDDAWGWEWLSWALCDHVWLEWLLDTIDIGRPEKRAMIYHELSIA